jgi:hypothetical protein
VWRSSRDSNACLYVGGYKSALNVDFLERHGIGLVVNTAKNLAAVLGPKYSRRLEVGPGQGQGCQMAYFQTKNPK